MGSNGYCPGRLHDHVWAHGVGVRGRFVCLRKHGCIWHHHSPAESSPLEGLQPDRRRRREPLTLWGPEAYFNHFT